MYKLVFMVSSLILTALIVLLLTSMLELNLLSSIALVAIGSVTSISMFGMFATDAKKQEDSFEDYMKSLKDRLDR